MDFENMTLSQVKEHCRKWRLEHGYPCEETGCDLKRRHICNDWAHEWDFDKLTAEELEICKAVGAKYISIDKPVSLPDVVELWKEKPVLNGCSGIYENRAVDARLAAVSMQLFPSLKPGDCICVNDIT